MCLKGSVIELIIYRILAESAEKVGKDTGDRKQAPPLAVQRHPLQSFR